MPGLADNLARSTPPSIKDSEYWAEAAHRAGRRLDDARTMMDAECASNRPLPSEERIGELERNLDAARAFYRACIEKLTGQSASDVERRLCA